MANLVYIATSIDGHIATLDGGVEWLSEVPNPTNSDYGFRDFINRVDGIILGRKSFDKVVEFGQWPYSKKVFVMSNSLKEVPSHLEGKAEIINGEIPDVLDRLHKEGFQNFYVDGGELIQSFLALDLIDEMIISTVPIILGDGIPLFGKLHSSVKFTKVETEVFHDHLVKTHYMR